MFRKWMVIGLLGIVAACAAVVGTAIVLDDANKRLLDGKWLGTFEVRGAVTGTIYANRPVTFVMDGASGKGAYTSTNSEGAVVWQVGDGKAIINVENGRWVFRHSGQRSGARDDFVFTLSRGSDGSLYLQTSWEATYEGGEGRSLPQIHSIMLKKQ